MTETPNHAFGNSAIIGRAFFQGKAPAPKLISMNQDRACMQEGGAQAHSEEAVIDPDGALANVFVYVKDGLSRRRYAISTTPVILDQHRCRYVRHVFGIQVGQTLKILNSDPTFHNVHAAAEKNRAFNLGMSKVEKVKTRTFDRVEVMIPIRCNVHPWMIAYAGVLAHPFYSVTDTAGGFKLSALPAGEYEIEAWHELFGTLLQKIKLAEAETTTIDFTFQQR
ncbi:MAG: carboxypeptidase regulatory-like domain-containing protein [bacterium]